MKIVLIAAVASLAVAPAVALADPPMHKQTAPGHTKTPPGLAKKPGGMPPGQAKKVWARGERLPMTYLNQSSYYITDPNAYRLPAAPVDYRWVRVNDDAYLANTRTGLITNVIMNLLR